MGGGGKVVAGLGLPIASNLIPKAPRIKLLWIICKYYKTKWLKEECKWSATMNEGFHYSGFEPEMCYLIQQQTVRYGYANTEPK